ncbi:MAG: hypothetical protein HY014_05745 [Acidobacteria bacterium]|nr:hypothetical protein [Acidobacteriota bacterium]MBI3487651.1 hypothetical protein [Acidobacteriota bacterium]
MAKATSSLPLQMLALAGLAGIAALLSNLSAPASRRLAWQGSLPVPALAAGPSQAALQPPPAPEAPAPKPDEGIRPLPPLAPLPPLPPKAPLPVAPSQAPPAPAVLAPAPAPIQEISAAEAWKAFQAGTPFLDARRSADFAEGHIAKAWSAPVWESDLEDRLFSFKAARRPGPEDPIVIYCSGGDCKDSHLLAAKLLEQGYFRLLIFREGFPAWVAQGRPVEKGQP